MSRYFVESSQICENEITITGEDYQHLKKVLRIQKGDVITVCCDGTDFISEVREIGDGYIAAGITEKKANRTEPALKVTLFQGLPKSDKMESIIQKCVEAGVVEIIPVITERCVVRINTEKDAGHKVARWQKIAMEAAKQCNRGIIPRVGFPVKFSEAVKMAAAMDLAVIPYEKESAVNFKEISSGLAGIKSGAIFIGPEGGFTEGEIEIAETSALRKITLGPRILRTETAGLVTLTIMMYELGDMSNGNN